MMEKSSADPRFAQITENYKRIRENIAAAAEKSGRMPGDIRFMAVTKTVEPVYINHALSLGISLIGENKVQEYLGKREYLNLAHCEKHLIGHLQTNKVRQIVGEVDMIESVDSLRLAQEISRPSLKRAECPPVHETGNYHARAVGGQHRRRREQNRHGSGRAGGNRLRNRANAGHSGLRSHGDTAHL